jgi:hypothetical protein
LTSAFRQKADRPRALLHVAEGSFSAVDKQVPRSSNVRFAPKMTELLGDGQWQKWANTGSRFQRIQPIGSPASHIKDDLLRQTRLAEPFGELIGVGRISKRQPTEMIHVRVSWIDLNKLAPNLAGLVEATQMT